MLNLLTDWWSSLWEWYTAHLAGFWVGLIFVVVFGILFRRSWVILAGIDAKWDEDKFRELHEKSDWNSAVTRRYSWAAFGLLYYALWVGAVLWWLDGFSWETYNATVYFTIATTWLITAPLRTFWFIAVVRKADAKRGFPHSHKFWEEVSKYYEDAFYRPRHDTSKPWFGGSLKFLNVFQQFRFIGQLITLKGLGGILGQMVIALGWPISMAYVCAHYYIEEAEDYTKHRAWWSFTKR